MSKQTENYIGSQQHWEDRINDDYDYLKQTEKKMEKEQHEMAFIEAIDEYSHRSFEEYYNETFKGHTRMTKQTTVEHLVKFPEISGEANTTSSQDTIAINPTNQGIIMTPKQKACELYTFYRNVIWDIGGELLRTIPVSERAKECALFTANQCQKELAEVGHYNHFYWQEVKQEIEKL